MCGIVAMLSKQKHTGFIWKDKGIFQQMLVANVFRGADSTGVFGVNKHGNVTMAKEASSSPYFLGKKAARDLLDDISSKHHIVVGHNRKATMGSTTDENAHPFIEDHIILVHNGTLTNHRKLADTTVDSHAICKSIATDGYKHMLKNIEGAYALIWYDAKLQTLFFTRNVERPLALVETEDRIYLASEAKMLDWILDRNDIKKYTIQNVPTGKVFKFSMDTRKLECESTPKKDKPVQNKHNQQVALLTDQRNSGQGNTNSNNRQHLSLVQHSSSSSSGMSLEDIASSYVIGSKVEFSCDDFDLFETGGKLIGTTEDGMLVEVLCWVDGTVPTHEFDALVNAEVLSARIQSVHLKPGKYVRLVVKDPEKSYYVKTKNNVQMSRLEFDSYGGSCYHCGTTLTDAEIKETTITFNRGGVSNIVCGDCIDAFKQNFPGARNATC